MYDSEPKTIELPLVGLTTVADVRRARAGQAATGTKGVFIQTLGCQMNEHDSEMMLGMLEQEGYQAVSTPLAADLILYNTCAVRENPERKLYGQVGMLRRLKELNPRLIVGICGCMTQQPTELGRIKDQLPHVDLVFGTHNIHRLPELLRRAESGERVIEVWPKAGPVVEGLPVRRQTSHKAYITIIYGCDQFCTYCIVPHVRGKERSRAASDIVAEAQSLANQGYREIMLLGQNVNAYGKDRAGSIGFAGLLRQVDAVPGVKRIRFLSPHPRYMGDDVIRAMAECPGVCEHVHLPVQAGSDRILRRMGRRYTRAEYLRLAETMRRAIPDLAVTTDLIVGFPGETEAEFQETLSLVREAAFDSAFMFIYSPRPGTAAARLDDQIPEEVKRDRIHRLIELQNAVSLEKNRALIGRTLEVLIDGAGKQPGTVSGRTRSNKLVTFPGEQDSVGRIVEVVISKAHTFGLEGEPSSGVY